MTRRRPARPLGSSGTPPRRSGHRFPPARNPDGPPPIPIPVPAPAPARGSARRRAPVSPTAGGFPATSAATGGPLGAAGAPRERNSGIAVLHASRLSDATAARAEPKHCEPYASASRHTPRPARGRLKGTSMNVATHWTFGSLLLLLTSCSGIVDLPPPGDNPSPGGDGRLDLLCHASRLDGLLFSASTAARGVRRDFRRLMRLAALGIHEARQRRWRALPPPRWRRDGHSTIICAQRPMAGCSRHDQVVVVSCATSSLPAGGGYAADQMSPPRAK